MSGCPYLLSKLKAPRVLERLEATAARAREGGLALIGRVYYNRRETINGAPASRGARRTKTRYRERPREQWITIPVPASSTPTPSSAPSTSAASTPSGARAGSNPATGCCAA